MASTILFLKNNSKRTLRLLLLILFLISNGTLWAQDTINPFDWQHVYKIDGEKCETVTDMAVSTNDDIVITGIYEDPGGCRFESASGEKVFEANSDTFPQSHSTVFLARYDENGKLKWAVKAFGESGIHPWALHCDNFGNSIVCGNFRDMAVFHSTDGNEQILKAVVTDHYSWMDAHPLNYFVAKYDPQGRLLWARVGLSSSNSVAFGAGSDSLGNIYVRAYCVGNSIAFNNFILLPQTGSGNYIQTYSVIILKYSPDGAEQWITYGGNATVKEMKVDPAGNVNLDCFNTGKITLFSTSGEYHKLPQSFPFEHTKLVFNNNGKLIDSISGEQGEYDLQVFKSVKARDGRTFAILQANPLESRGRNFKFIQDGIENKTKDYDIFLGCYAADGKQDWMVQFNGPNEERPLDIVLDTAGNIILSGWYLMELAVIDVNGDSINLSSAIRSLFIAMFSPDGKLIGAENTGNMCYSFRSFAEYLNLVVDSKNRLYISGQVNMPSTLGSQQLTIRGPRGENGSWENEHGIEWYKYSDGFLGMADIDIHPNKRPALVAQNNNLVKKDSVVFSEPQTPNIENSQTAESETGNPDPINAVLYPNPIGNTQDMVNVRLELDKTYFIKWIITDANGNVLQLKDGNYYAGIQYERFSFAGYSSGIYTMIIRVGTTNITKRIVVAL
ncbi:MAG: hypothetical protein CVU11_03690 [Bacteroidetes bacterium HGW-Bacteroidetes-6]|jgi:hypothetical protein|nr:MAG: hypothetical protein CVU11_03690 [Bacteroidetes bacterium HGW-Bacteroidetes-6]